MSSVSQTGSSSYDSLDKFLYKGTGDVDKKEEVAKDVKKASEVNDIPESEGSEWKKPICTVYDCFNTWLDKDEEQSKAVYDTVKSALNFSWYMAGSDISTWDIDKYNEELFDTTDAQEQYKKYLKAEDGVNGDPVGIKFQSGNIMADERAFRLRHASIARTFACGICAKNKHNFLKELYTNTVNKIREQCDKEWEALHTDHVYIPGDSNTAEE